jgi:UDP-N-acetylglucosamine 2-epimerase (non-hydrolysing)
MYLECGRLLMRVMTVFGTRPEAIKMAPVALALDAASDIESVICTTGQHRQMLDQVMRIFDLAADVDLNVMQPGQDLYDVTSRVLLGMRDVLREHEPDLVLVHGDTTTCLAAGLAAFYKGIPVGHVEAGLRTGNLRAPFPEEANRSLVGRFAEMHFAPTARAQHNLLAENVNPQNIWITGNTVIDALLIARDKVQAMPSICWNDSLGRFLCDRLEQKQGPVILITGHRRENFGQGFIDICDAIRTLALSHPDWLLVYPVHLNPNVQKPVLEMLSGLTNVVLIEPLEYLPFIWLMDRCDLILTDSGGIQEEGPALGKPVLVMREVTERPEAVDAGTVRLVGTEKHRIIAAVESLLGDDIAYRSMATATNPFGNGTAALQIQAAIRQRFQKPAFIVRNGSARRS